MAKARKGQSQDALGGLNPPQVAGMFTATGEQSMAPATSGIKPVASWPTNGLPGVASATLGGQSTYGIVAEQSGGLDLTKKAIKRAVKRAIKNAGNNGNVTVQQLTDAITATCAASDIRDVGGQVLPKYLAKAVKQVQRDPVAALSRLELLSRQLKPTHPARMSAAAFILRSKLVAHDTPLPSGLKKAVASIDPIELLGVASEVEAALGISGSAAPFSPNAIDARSQLQRIMGGQQSASLRGTQDPKAMTAYTSPAAALGAVLKRDGSGDELIAAEQAVAKAEQSGDMFQLSAAREHLAYLRLRAAHRAEGMS